MYSPAPRTPLPSHRGSLESACQQVTGSRSSLFQISEIVSEIMIVDTIINVRRDSVKPPEPKIPAPTDGKFCERRGMVKRELTEGARMY